MDKKQIDSELAALQANRTRLVADVARLQGEESKARKVLEDAVLAGKSVDATHELREITGQVEIHERALRQVDTRIRELQEAAAEWVKLQEATVMLERESAIRARLPIILNSIEALHKQVLTWQEISKNVKPITPDSGPFLTHITFVQSTIEEHLRKAADDLRSMMKP